MNPIPRREFIKLSGTLGAGLATLPFTSAAAGSVTPPVRPNILVFLTDDHGQWAQRCYGNSELITPNLDRLAARGVRMRQTFTTWGRKAKVVNMAARKPSSSLATGPPAMVPCGGSGHPETQVRDERLKVPVAMKQG